MAHIICDNQIRKMECSKKNQLQNERMLLRRVVVHATSSERHRQNDSELVMQHVRLHREQGGFTQVPEAQAQ